MTEIIKYFKLQSLTEADPAGDNSLHFKQYR